MQRTNFFRDVFLVASTFALGWRAHGGRNTVEAAQAAHTAANHASSETSVLQNSFGGMTIEHALPNGQPSLSVYSAADHIVYVYPTQTGNSHINCAYALHIERAGGPLERRNCEVGSAF